MKKNQKNIRIGTNFVGNNKQIFVIAEAGVNHNNNLKMALKMVDIAKKSAGAWLDGIDEVLKGISSFVISSPMKG